MLRNLTIAAAAVACCTLSFSCSDQLSASALEGLVTVESVTVDVVSQSPAVVRVQVTGFLADPCTALDRVEQSRNAEEFTAQMFTTREADAICVQVIVPFEGDFLLEHSGLAAADYGITVNGVRAAFRIP